MPRDLRRMVTRFGLYRRAAVPLWWRRPGGWRHRLGALSERPVFIVGSPRSGTTFLGRSLGSLPGFLDLGEVAPFKAAMEDGLPFQAPGDAAPRIRRMLAVTRRLGLVGALRAVEQTPEGAFVVDAILRAFPEARVVHMLRDGRDVSSSLLSLGWLSSETLEKDDVGLEFGARPRFWVEAERAAEFVAVSDARRAAWAWRRYVSAARVQDERVLEVRYERLVVAPGEVGRELAAHLDIPAAPLSEALERAHAGSVGRHRSDLTPEQLDDVVDEAGALLRGLGYL